MIGFYDYTMWLTYLSLVSASIGIVVSLGGIGHPFIGMFFLLFSGFCDAFDGIVARSKKDRTEMQCKYGVQIDSLSDVVAFGVLPVCIGAALVARSNVFSFNYEGEGLAFSIVCYAIMAVYVLTAMIRLAYFNVTEEERQKVESGKRKSYLGLPVTSASIIFPAILLVQYIMDKFFNVDITFLYFCVMLVTAVAFVTKFKLKKPGFRAVLAMVAVGLVEAIIMVVAITMSKS